MSFGLTKSKFLSYIRHQQLLVYWDDGEHRVEEGLFSQLRLALIIKLNVAVVVNQDPAVKQEVKL
jgi:hypothetical protein